VPLFAGRSSNKLCAAGAAIALLCWLDASPAAASKTGPSASAPATAGDAGVKRIELPLPPLPKAPSITLPRPESDQLEQLDGLLARIRSKDLEDRSAAVREILELSPAIVPAIDHRVNAIAESADREAMKNVLGAIRTKARSDVREKLEAEGKRGSVDTPDYLEMLTLQARPDSKAWQDLVALAAMSRALVHVGTVEAARELVDVCVRFGDLLRVDTQLQLAKLGDRAVAALIEARRHQAPKISNWAERQLDALGKGIPSEAVQTTDQQVLADILRAYGRTRDPDAARIVISFSNSERAQIREAARQAIALMGEVGGWQLRDAYENVVGKKPPRDWSWERTARELFGEQDRLRLSRVYTLFEDGMRAKSAGRLDDMRRAFDQVLSRSPDFERGGEMAPGYFAFARETADQHPAEAIAALRRVRRLAITPEERAQAESWLLTLEGERLLGTGIADQTLARRAIEVDASNERAKKLLARIERGELHARSGWARWAAAGAIGVGAVAAIAFIVLRRPRTGAKRASASDPAESH